MKWHKENPDRLKSEVALIRGFYPQTRIIIKKGRLTAYLWVHGMKARYQLKIIYPDEFPYDEPLAYVIEPKINDAPHTWWCDGHLSIHGDAEPPCVSGKIIMDWAVIWIRVYENWLDTGKWPETIRGQ